MSIWSGDDPVTNATVPSRTPVNGVQTDHRSERRFVIAAWIGYVLMLCMVAWSHEPWQDETRAWQLAATSDGILALAHNVQYEGHPMLYFLFLKGIAFFSRSWMTILAVHVGIAAATSWIVLRHAPFSRLQRLLVVFGYYLGYEYAVFSRPYSLGMLFAVGAVAAWCAAPRKTWVTGVLVVLLASTSIVGLGLSLALMAGMLVDMYWDGNRTVKGLVNWRILAVLAASVIVVGFVFWQVVPAPSAEYHGAGLLGDSGASLWSLAWLISLPTRVIVPIQMMTGDLMHWGYWVFTANGRVSSFVAMVLSAAITLLWFILASRRPTGAAILVSSLLGYALLFGLIHEGSFRHHGHLAIAWILAVWMVNRGPKIPLPVPALGRLEALVASRSWLLTVALLPMTLAYLPAAWSEIRHPFSDASTVAQLLEQPDLDSLPIVGVAQPWSQTVAALANKPIHFPSGLVAIVDYRMAHFSGTELMARSHAVESQLLQTHCRILVISSPKLLYTSQFRTTPLYRTPKDGTMTNAEAYVVELAYAPPSSQCPGRN